MIVIDETVSKLRTQIGLAEEVLVVLQHLRKAVEDYKQLEDENKLLRECISSMAQAKDPEEIKRILCKAGIEEEK
jgi:regulator of replication initiation timing